MSGLEDNLAFMTEKVHNLQRNYVQMQDLALLEIEKLKHHIEELKNRPHRKFQNFLKEPFLFFWKNEIIPVSLSFILNRIIKFRI